VLRLNKDEKKKYNTYHDFIVMTHILIRTLSRINDKKLTIKNRFILSLAVLTLF